MVSEANENTLINTAPIKYPSIPAMIHGKYGLATLSLAAGH